MFSGTVCAFNEELNVISMFVALKIKEACKYRTVKVGQRIIFNYSSYGYKKFYGTVIGEHYTEHGTIIQVKTDMVKSEIKWPIVYVWVSDYRCRAFDRSGILNHVIINHIKANNILVDSLGVCEPC
jgi:hypothetical protein